jgi:hypothetical protein
VIGGGPSVQVAQSNGHAIDPRRKCRHWIPTLAEWHFDYWGALTRFGMLDEYRTALDRWSAGDNIPTVLVAIDQSRQISWRFRVSTQ